MDQYRVVTIRNVAFLISGIIVLVLGILAAIYGEAEQIAGYIILLSATTGLATLLMSVGITSLVVRARIQRNIIRTIGDVAFVNTVKDLTVLELWKLVKFVGDLSILLPMEVVCELDDDLMECRRCPGFKMDQKIPCFEPRTMIFFKKKGTVIWRWRGLEKKASGLQKGNNVEIELTLDNPERMISLIKHELGHVFLSWRYPRMNTSEQHGALHHAGY